MQNKQKKKLSEFKSKRQIKKWRQQIQPTVQPIVVPSSSASTQLIKKSYIRSSLQRQGVIKRNTIYYSDQSYSINCVRSFSRYVDQENPEMLPALDVGSSFKKKRISRSAAKKSKRTFKLDKSEDKNQQCSTLILNKIMTDRKSRFNRKSKLLDSSEQQEIKGNNFTSPIVYHCQEQKQEEQKRQQEYQEEQQQPYKLHINQQQEQYKQQQEQIKSSRQPKGKQQQTKEKQTQQQQQQLKIQPQNEINIEQNQIQPLTIQQLQTKINKKQPQIKIVLITCPIQLPPDYESIKNLFYSPVQTSKRHICLLKHVSFGLKSRYLLFSSQLRLLLSAESQIGSIGANYYFFIGQPKQKEDREYMGKLRGNMFETLLSLYNRGLSYKRTENPGRRRQLLANIITTKQNGQTVTKVIVPRADTHRPLLKQNWKSLEHFEEFFQSSTLSMKCLVTKKQTPKLQTLKSSSSAHSNSQDKRKRVLKQASQAKPMIECDEYKESLCVRKIYDNLYEISIAEPLSIFQAFGIVLGRCKGKLESL